MNKIRISKSKKNPVFDCMFSFDDNTLQDVTPKFDEPNLYIFYFILRQSNLNYMIILIY